MMKRFNRCVVSGVMLFVLAAAGCTTKPGDAQARAAAAVAVAGPGWLRTELYFAIGDWTETALSTEPESRWSEFLDREVTPRFSDGLTVIDVYGQWRESKPGAPILRERSRLLVLVHPNTQEAAEKIEAIRAAWKLTRGENSVLRVSQPADVNF